VTIVARLRAKLLVAAAFISTFALDCGSTARADESAQPRVLDERYTCGRNALYALASIMGYSISSDSLRSNLNDCPGPTGVSLLELQTAAEAIGFPTIVRRLSFQELLKTRPPYIAHFTTSHVLGAPSGHFVVVVRIAKSRIYYLDGTTAVFAPWKLDTFRSNWSGYILQPTSIAREPADNGLDALLIGLLATNSLLVVVVALAPRLTWPNIISIRSFISCSLAASLFAVFTLGGSVLAESPSESSDQSVGEHMIWRIPTHDAINCIYVFLRIHDVPVNYLDLMRRLPPDRGGATILAIRDICRDYGLPTVVAKLTPANLTADSLPAIVQFSERLDDGGAYAIVVANGGSDCYLITGDTATIKHISLDIFRRNWSGYAMTLETGQGSLVNILLVICAAFGLAYWLYQGLTMRMRQSAKE
jgi:ABC-type bacteriocin/lantibiotic exporter with double-glycine peptidase domain